MIALAENRYGKSRVRLAQVKRIADRHDFREWTVEILLEGDFESCFVAWRQQQNSSHRHHEEHGLFPGAKFCGGMHGRVCARNWPIFFWSAIRRFRHAESPLSEKAWEHLQADGKPHPTTFVQSSGEHQTTNVTRIATGAFSVTSGSRKSRHHENFGLGL